MTMTNKEAATIISLIDAAFDMNFAKDEFKVRLWVEQLTAYGDYDRTLRKTTKYIRESRYKPTIAQIIDYKPPEMESTVPPEEETHAYKMKHDSEYASQHRRLKERWEQLKREWAEEDE